MLVDSSRASVRRGARAAPLAPRDAAGRGRANVGPGPDYPGGGRARLKPGPRGRRPGCRPAASRPTTAENRHHPSARRQTGTSMRSLYSSAVSELDQIAAAYNQMSGAIQESTDSLVHRAFHDSAHRATETGTFSFGLHAGAGRPPTKHRVAVLFLDIDRFKYLNDTLGHGVGDQLLSAFSQRLVGAAEGRWWRGWAGTSSPCSCNRQERAGDRLAHRRGYPAFIAAAFFALGS
jgi:hypothetical protein